MLTKLQKAIKELINARFQLLGSSDAILSTSSGSETFEDQGHLSPTSCPSISNGYAEEEGSDEDIKVNPKASPEIIDLMDDTEEYKSGGSFPYIELPSLSPNKRKRSVLRLGRESSNDCKEEYDAELLAKRIRKAGLVVLEANEIIVRLGDRCIIYYWDQRLKTWRGRTGFYTISGLLSRNLEFFVSVRVKLKGDKILLFLYLETIGDKGLIFSGLDVRGFTVDAAVGEMRDMICNPKGGPYYRYITV